MKLKGIGASSGIAIAKVFELVEIEVEIVPTQIEDVAAEIVKVKQAIATASNQISNVKTKAHKNIGADAAAIFDAHMQVANDPALLSEIENELKHSKKNAIYVTKQVTDRFAKMFIDMEDEYMQERAADVKDVAKRIINALAGVVAPDPSTISEEVVVVAHDLTPSDTAMLNKKYVKGFVTDIGGRTSHAAIMARSLEIPAVLGLNNITKQVKNGTIIAMDGESGEVTINPSPKEVAAFEAQAQIMHDHKMAARKFVGKRSQTKDGIFVEIAANIGAPSDVENVRANDAEGIGLFRSEFLYMNATDWPTEQQQYEAYKQVLSQMKNHRVVVRTLDIGGDKKLPYYNFPSEMNPFLGYRAIRLCLDQVDIFKTQLRALLRASQYGKLAIMFPMIATLNELHSAKQILAQCQQELDQANIPYRKDIEVGMMVEIPAAAILAHQFAKHVDFFSIGTNDLMQYTMAADRMSEKVAYLYQPLNPALLTMINMTIKGAHANGKWVGMCGEMAGDHNVLPLLAGMGLDEYSMSASSILKTRMELAKIDAKSAQHLVEQALSKTTAIEVEQLVTKFWNKLDDH